MKHSYAGIAFFSMLSLVTAADAGAQLPAPTVTFEEGRTAIVVTDPQNDFLNRD